MDLVQRNVDIDYTASVSTGALSIDFVVCELNAQKVQTYLWKGAVSKMS